MFAPVAIPGYLALPKCHVVTVKQFPVMKLDNTSELKSDSDGEGRT